MVIAQSVLSNARENLFSENNQTYFVICLNAPTDRMYNQFDHISVWPRSPQDSPRWGTVYPSPSFRILHAQAAKSNCNCLQGDPSHTGAASPQVPKLAALPQSAPPTSRTVSSQSLTHITDHQAAGADIRNAKRR